MIQIILVIFLRNFRAGVRAMKQDTATFLELVLEVRIGELIRGGDDKRYEASGVCLKDDYLHIIFDSDTRLLRLKPDLRQPGEKPVLLELKGTGTGYEDITYQSSANRWYCLIEAAETKSGRLHAARR